MLASFLTFLSLRLDSSAVKWNNITWGFVGIKPEKKCLAINVSLFPVGNHLGLRVEFSTCSEINSNFMVICQDFSSKSGFLMSFSLPV